MTPIGRFFHPRKLAMVLGITAMAIGLPSCSIFEGSGDASKTPTVGKRTPVLARAESGAEVDPNIAGVSVILPPAILNTDWTQPGGNAAKAMGHLQMTGNFSRASATGITGSTTRYRLAATPVVLNGNLYVMDTDGVVYSYNAKTGSKNWSTGALRVQGDGKQSAFGGGVSAENGKVFATNGVGEVAALNANDGSVIWRKKPAGPLRGAPTLAFNQVLVMSQDNQLFALSENDGSLSWNEAGTIGLAGVFGVAAPAAGQGTIVAGYSSGELIAYRYENGRNLWSDALARTSISTSVSSISDIDADPIIDRGRVFALGEGGRMASYELVTGQRIWELNIAGISTPVISGEWLFVLTDDARMLAIARTSGKVRWITTLQRYRDAKDRKGEIHWYGPVLAGNRLITVSSKGEVYSVSPGEGSATMVTDLNTDFSLPPIVANNMLYLLADNGTIYAYQ